MLPGRQQAKYLGRELFLPHPCLLERISPITASFLAYNAASSMLGRKSLMTSYALIIVLSLTLTSVLFSVQPAYFSKSSMINVGPRGVNKS